jgi:hypothetical protein
LDSDWTRREVDIHIRQQLALNDHFNCRRVEAGYQWRLVKSLNLRDEARASKDAGQRMPARAETPNFPPESANGLRARLAQCGEVDKDPKAVVAQTNC